MTAQVFQVNSALLNLQGMDPNGVQQFVKQHRGAHLGRSLLGGRGQREAYARVMKDDLLETEFANE